MGQAIQVESSRVDDVVIFTTDRSITGQDGLSYSSADEANGDDRFPGRLAARLFDLDAATSSVWVASNLIVVRRDGGWDEESVGAASGVIGDFFLFYPTE
jgi:hypothetical protein